MNKNNKLDKILEIIKCNDIIDKLYKKLLELDKNGMKDSKEYYMIIDLLRDYSDKETKMISFASYYDDETNEILDNIQYLNHMSEDYINYIDEAKNTKIKRLLCHYSQQALVQYDFPNEMLIPDNNAVFIDGIAVPTADALDTFEELDDGIYNILNGILNETKEKNFEDYATYNYLLYCRNALQHHTTADYLEETIKNEKNQKIRNKLLEFKYKMIAIYSCLERPFLKNPNNYSRTTYYQDVFNDYYKDNVEFFEDWDSYYQDQVDNAIADIMGNEKEKITNINERYQNKLVEIYLKAYSSIFSSEELLDMANLKKELAIKITKNKINKKRIQNTLNLNQDLLLSKKLIKN